MSYYSSRVITRSIFVKNVITSHMRRVKFAPDTVVLAQSIIARCGEKTAYVVSVHERPLLLSEMRKAAVTREKERPPASANSSERWGFKRDTQSLNIFLQKLEDQERNLSCSIGVRNAYRAMGVKI